MSAKPSLDSWFNALSAEGADRLRNEFDATDEIPTYWVTRLHQEVGIHPNELRTSQPGEPQRYAVPDALAELINASRGE